MDFMFLSNSQIHILSFVFDFDYQLDILSTCLSSVLSNAIFYGTLMMMVMWIWKIFRWWSDTFELQEVLLLLINFRTERRYSGPAHVQFQKIWICKEATQVHLPNQCISNWWFSVCLRIFCLIVLILLPKLLGLEQQIPDLVSSVFGCGVDIVKESIEDERPDQQAA